MSVPTRFDKVGAMGPLFDRFTIATLTHEAYRDSHPSSLMNIGYSTFQSYP